MTYRVSGTVNGLTGTLVLQNNGADDLVLTADGSFAFLTAIADRSPFLLSISAQPTGQTCSISNGSGTVFGINITDAKVTCSTNTYRVGGSVTGLVGELVVQNNGGDATTISADGTFSFNAPLAVGSNYSVTISRKPFNQVCSARNTLGTSSNADVENVEISCVNIVPKHAYVVNAYGLGFGSPPGIISHYIIGADGKLTPSTKPSLNAGENPLSVTVAPGGRHAYVATEGGAVLQYKIDSDGSLAAMTPASVPGGTNPYSITVSPRGRYAYVPNWKNYTISQYTIGSGGGLAALNPPFVSAPAGKATTPLSIAIDSGERYAYVADYGTHTISQYTIGPDGGLTPMTMPAVEAGEDPISIALSPDGRYAYAANWTGHTISQYKIGDDGSLAPMTTPSFVTGNNPRSIVVDPSGRYVYVANSAASVVSQYTIGADGSLAPMTPATVPAGVSPRVVTIDRGGRYAYVLDNQGTVLQFAFGPNGELVTMAATPPVNVGATPKSIAIVSGTP